MKFGIRTPSLKKSIKARTTGKLKRQVKKAVIPFYGEKGTGIIKDPQKAIYNKIYDKTSIGVNDLMKTSSPKEHHSQNTSQPTISSTTTYINSSSKKHPVICMECGREFDANNEVGTLYVKKSRRYICPTCAQNRGKVKEYSPSFYKTCGNILLILSIIIFVFSLLLTIAVPPIGLVFIAIGLLFFLLGKNYKKKAKKMIEATQTTEP